MENNQSEQPIGFEDLAQMIQEGFHGVDDRLEAVDSRLDGMDRRFDGLEQTLETMRHQLGNVGDRLQLVETKLDRALHHEMARLEARIKRLEEAVGVSG